MCVHPSGFLTVSRIRTAIYRYLPWEPSKMNEKRSHSPGSYKMAMVSAAHDELRNLFEGDNVKLWFMAGPPEDLEKKKLTATFR